MPPRSSPRCSVVKSVSPRTVRLAGCPPTAKLNDDSCWRSRAMRSAVLCVMPWSAAPPCSWRVAGSRLPPAGTWAKSWPRVTGLRIWLFESPPSSAFMKAPRRLPPRRRRHDDPAGLAEEGVLEVHERELGEQLLGPEDRIGLLGGEACAEGGVGRHGRHGEAAPEIQREGLGEVLVALAARGEVAVADDGLGRPGQLQARGQAAAVALRERRRGAPPRGRRRA